MAAILPAPETLAPLDPLAWQAAADMAEEAGDDKRAHHCRQVALRLREPGPLRPSIRDRFELAFGHVGGAFHVVPASGAVTVAVREDAGECHLTGPLRPVRSPAEFTVRPRWMIFEWRSDDVMRLYVHPEDLPALCC